MRVLIHTHISCRLLVEGSAPKPLLNTEFHSVAARSANAFEDTPKRRTPLSKGIADCDTLMVLGDYRQTA